MLDWLKSMGDSIVTIFELIVSFFSNAFEAIALVFKSFTTASGLVQYLPDVYRTVMVSLLAYLVIRAVIKFGG